MLNDKIAQLIVLSIISCGFLYVPVYGHANPLTYDPKPNQIYNSVKSIPDKLSIVYTEIPEIKASSIKVVDQNNTRVDKNDLSISEPEKKLSISLDRFKIHPGVYHVNWLVLSKGNGHITKGAYIFTLTKENSSENQTVILNHTSCAAFNSAIRMM